jgi:hypothetical protein
MSQFEFSDLDSRLPSATSAPSLKQHRSLKGLSPAMAAGISPTLWGMTDLAEMIDASLPKPGPRGPYEKRMVV